MKKEKWIAIIEDPSMLICYPFYFLHFIDYQIAGVINNDKLITYILFIPFIIDVVILLACRGRDIKKPSTYRIWYYTNLVVFSIFLAFYLLIIFVSSGLDTKNFS